MTRVEPSVRLSDQTPALIISPDEGERRSLALGDFVRVPEDFAEHGLLRKHPETLARLLRFDQEEAFFAAARAHTALRVAPLYRVASLEPVDGRQAWAEAVLSLLGREPIGLVHLAKKPLFEGMTPLQVYEQAAASRAEVVQGPHGFSFVARGSWSDEEHVARGHTQVRVGVPFQVTKGGPLSFSEVWAWDMRNGA